MALCQDLSHFVELLERSNVPISYSCDVHICLNSVQVTQMRGGLFYFSFARISRDSIMHQIWPNHLEQ